MMLEEIKYIVRSNKTDHLIGHTDSEHIIKTFLELHNTYDEYYVDVVEGKEAIDALLLNEEEEFYNVGDDEYPYITNDDIVHNCENDLANHVTRDLLVVSLDIGNVCKFMKDQTLVHNVSKALHSTHLAMILLYSHSIEDYMLYKVEKEFRIKEGYLEDASNYGSMGFVVHEGLVYNTHDGVVNTWL